MMSTCQTNIDRDIVPLQPELSKQLHYSERLLKWNPYSKKNLALCYQFQTGRDGTPIRLIPDACIDFLFKCDRENPVAVVSGVQTAPRELVLAPDSVYFGFKPYSPKGMRPLGAAWHGLTDETDTPDFVELSELQLCQARGNIRMEVISDYTGYTGRYCREKFKEAHGISIKNYSSIMRFQNAVRMLSRQDDEASLSDIVFDNGYFDQSHLNREFRRFCGDTPLRFRREVLCRS